MKSDSLPFSIVRYQIDILRQEVVNVGVVLFEDSGPVVHLAPAQGKLLALNPNFSLGRVFDQARRLADALKSLWDDEQTIQQMVAFFSHGGSLSLTPPGVIQRQDRPIESITAELLHDLVEPPPKSRIQATQKSRLHTELRNVFREGKILGSRPEDINKHLIVPNFPIDADTGLFAEFAIRNGQLHVTETIDFRTSSPSAKRLEAQAKSLLFVEAEEKVGADDLRRYVVVTGASAQVQSSMNLLSRYADDFIVRESQEDWRRYVDAMHRAAMPDQFTQQ